MRNASWSRLSFLAIAASALPFAASGQDAQTSQANETQVAEQCLEDLAAFSQRLNQEQWWITGWGGVGGWGWGPGGVPPGGPAVQPGTAEPVDPATGVAAPGTAPWGVPLGVMQSPRDEIRVLYLAANVLASQGKQDGCDYLLAELRDTYENYARQLTEAGVDPAQITSWRQEQIALAEPVEELQTEGLTVDDLTGTDVRTRDDESLGSVADVVFDHRSGQLRYVVVSRGGFLGMGEDLVPVPWEHLRMAPGLNTLVLDVPVATMETAPALDENGFFDPDADPEGARVVEEFWGGQSTGGQQAG